MSTKISNLFCFCLYVLSSSFPSFLLSFLPSFLPLSFPPFLFLHNCVYLCQQGHAETQKLTICPISHFPYQHEELCVTNQALCTSALNYSLEGPFTDAASFVFPPSSCGRQVLGLIFQIMRLRLSVYKVTFPKFHD